MLVGLTIVSFATPLGIAALAQQPAAVEISAEALAQIEALIAEKESRSPVQQKVDSQLIYEARQRAGTPVAAGVQTLENDVPYAPDGHPIVDVRASVTPELLAQLRALGAEILSSTAESVRMHIELSAAEAVAALPAVQFVGPRQDAMTTRASGPVRSMSADAWTAAAGDRRRERRKALAAFLNGAIDATQIANDGTGQGSRSSEGDVTHRANVARASFGANGTGIKIGVLSNGVVNLAASQALGDLGPVTVLSGQTGTGDEGTAMLEIIHDLAPGAQLFFATALTSITSFAQNIRDLRSAGCDIIVDDVFYFVETPFQDGAPLIPTPTNGGVVIQAVKDVTAAGALYFSSAGNSGNLNDGTAGVWEGNFVDGGPTAPPLEAGNRLHSFGASPLNFITAVNTSAPISLYWSDPLGASSNDYDLFRLNAFGTAVSASSTNIQNGTQDPYEQVSQNVTQSVPIVIVKKAAAAARYLHVNMNRGRLTFTTAGQTHGHSTADSIGAYGVAATPAVGPFPNAFSSANVVETFSSDGPRRIFYQGNGTPFTPSVLADGGKVLNKPDITAADGVAVTGVGGFPNPFSGTSAAAPHAAAIAALLKSAIPNLTQAQIRAALTSTAIDIEAPGVDRDSGAGIIMPVAALTGAGAVGTAFLELSTVAATENPGDGNGTITAGEGASLVIGLRNVGGGAATNIAATLTASTPDVTITQPSLSPYPNLPSVSGAGNNQTPLLFTVASTAACPGTPSFALNVTYAEGNASLPFTIPLGMRTVNINSKLDGIAPVSTPFFSAVTGTQIGRINRVGTASTCGTRKVFPGLAATTGTRAFDAYTFNSCATSVPSCVTVTMTNSALGTGPTLFDIAYIPSFNPADLSPGYRADPAVSRTDGGPLSFSFDLPGGGTPFTLAVHEVSPGAGVGDNYSLSVSGGCFGSCVPNKVPIAKAKNVTVFASPVACNAPASVDDGSSDPDGDPLTITQSPAGPYALGTTPVLLTVVDPRGATSQVTGSVTVIDNTPPVVANVSAAPSVLWPPNHQMMDVTVGFDLTDNCGGACTLTVSSDEPQTGTGDGDTPGDWNVVDSQHVQLRAERAGAGGGRTYTLTLTCTDAAGNATVKTTKVFVPHSQ